MAANSSRLRGKPRTPRGQAQNAAPRPRPSPSPTTETSHPYHRRTSNPHHRHTDRAHRHNRQMCCNFGIWICIAARTSCVRRDALSRKRDALTTCQGAALLRQDASPMAPDALRFERHAPRFGEHAQRFKEEAQPAERAGSRAAPFAWAARAAAAGIRRFARASAGSAPRRANRNPTSRSGVRHSNRVHEDELVVCRTR